MVKTIIDQAYSWGKTGFEKKVKIIKVDGVESTAESGFLFHQEEIHILPGSHQLNMSVQWDRCRLCPPDDEFDMGAHNTCKGDIQFVADAGHRYYGAFGMNKRPMELMILDVATDEMVAQGVCTWGCDKNDWVFLTRWMAAPEDACAKSQEEQ